MSKIENIQLLQLSVGGFAVMSLSFMLMPLTWAGVMPGLLFWLGLALGIAGQVILAIRARKAGWQMGPKRWGLLTFFANKWAKLADLAAAVGAVLTVIALTTTGGYGYVCYVLLTATVFAFCMHCILNGKIMLFAIRQTDPPACAGKNKKVKNEGGKGTR